MELRTTREMRRNEQLSKVMAKKAEGEVPAQAQSALRQRRTPADKLTLSRQALTFVQERNQKMWEAEQRREQRRQDRMNDSLSALESSKQELDLLSKGLKVLEACRKIAASIMKGDNVPPEDLKYLMENDPEGFKMAMAMRRPKEDPEDVESVLDDEDRNGGSTEGSGDSGEAPAVEAAGASQGGGITGPSVKD